MNLSIALVPDDFFFLLCGEAAVHFTVGFCSGVKKFR
jgi:hypothetical protein